MLWTIFVMLLVLWALGKKLGFDIKREPDSGDNELVIYFISPARQ